VGTLGTMAFLGEDTLSGNAGRGSLGPAGTKLQQNPKRLCLTYLSNLGPKSRKCGAEEQRRDWRAGRSILV